MVPVMRVLSMRSFMRFRQRRSVDLPQPEGPMKAVTIFSPDVHGDVVQDVVVPVAQVDVLQLDGRRPVPAAAGARALPS
jgi:hypothetical protein